MGIDLRIVFLLLIAVTLFLLIIRRGAFVSVGNIFDILLDFFLVLAVSGTVIVFFFLLTRQDPIPYLRTIGYQTSLKQLISFEDAIPPRLENNLVISDIYKEDTDGDEYKEWVVFYEFDLQGGVTSVGGFIYDNDRGNPPIVFPYALRPPNRDYISDGKISSFELEEVVSERNGPNQRNLPEILVTGHEKKDLNIFSFRDNSALWDFPRDAPPRYQPLGSFRGTDGVTFDQTTKNVTVNDRSGFERSQLVNRSVYALNENTQTYWDQYYDPAELDRKLAAPIVSTVDFPGSGSPDNILDNTFPEKIVLAFYAATCGSTDLTLCRHADENWNPRDFLDPNGDAYREFANDNPGYFEIPNFNNNQNLSVSFLRYYPQLETDRDLMEIGGGRDVVTGEEAAQNVVDISFTVNGSVENNVRLKMMLVDGRWKISHQLQAPDLPALGDPTTLGQ